MLQASGLLRARGLRWVAAMRTLHALGALLSFALAAATLLVPTAPADAQEPTVAARLLAQTSFTTSESPELTIAFQAENVGDEAFDELSVGFIIGPQITSRVQFEESLVDGPAGTLIFVDTFSQEGSLGPGTSREFSVTVDLDDIDGVSAFDSLVYPSRVDLRSEGTPIASIDTPLVHLVREPEVPMRLSWWASFDAPVAMDPQGRLDDPAFEAAIAEGGGLSQQVETLQAAVGASDGEIGVNLVITPAVIDQLARMADGYERAVGEGRAGGHRRGRVARPPPGADDRPRRAAGRHAVLRPASPVARLGRTRPRPGSPASVR
jgi:hypothetical protein